VEWVLVRETQNQIMSLLQRGKGDLEQDDWKENNKIKLFSSEKIQSIYPLKTMDSKLRKINRNPPLKGWQKSIISENAKITKQETF